MLLRSIGALRTLLVLPQRTEYGHLGPRHTSYIKLLVFFASFSGAACGLQSSISVCQTNEVPSWDGSCEPSAALGGGNPILYFPLTDTSINCHTYDGHPQNACDLPTPIGTPVGAPVTGIVFKKAVGCKDNYAKLNGDSPGKDCNGGAGNYIIIKTDDGLEAWLEHLQENSILVAEGDHVCAGTQVASSGSSGHVFSTIDNGAHLHIAAKIASTWTYPDDIWLGKDTYKLCVNCPPCSDPSPCTNGSMQRCWVECVQSYSAGCIHTGIPPLLMGIQTCDNGTWGSCGVNVTCSTFKSPCTNGSMEAAPYVCLDGTDKPGTLLCTKPIGASCNSSYFSNWPIHDCDDLCTDAEELCQTKGAVRDCTVFCDTPSGETRKGTQKCTQYCGEVTAWGPCLTDDACTKPIMPGQGGGDPAYCGDGTCAVEETCDSCDLDCGPCEGGCPPPLQACGATCVDISSDPDNCGACAHSCQGGECNSTICAPFVLADNQDAPQGIAVDATHVYWTTWFDNPQGPMLRRASLAGGAVLDMASGSAWGSFGALTALGDGVYLVAYDHLRIAPFGGGPTTFLADGNKYPEEITSDATALYWTSLGNSPSTCNLMKMVWGSSPTALASTAGIPRGIAADNTSIFWGTYQTGNVFRASKMSGQATPIVSAQGSIFDVAVDGDSVYWVEDDTGTVMKANKVDGSNALMLASGQFNARGIDVDSNYVYWTSMTNGTVMRALKDGSQLTTLAAGQASPFNIIVDAKSIYWINRVASGGAIMKIAK